MRSLLKCIALLGVCVLGAFAQAYDDYTISYSVALSNAQTALAVQLPTTGTGQAEVLDASVQCTASCPFRIEVNGAAATSGNATAQAVVALNPETTPAALVTTPKITAWTGSGIPVGTAVSPVWTLPGGALVPFGSARVLYRASTGVPANSNYIMRIPANYTGTVTLFFAVRVRR